MKSVFTVLTLLCAIFSNAQTYNAAFQDIDFGGTGVTITNKVGTGLAAGDVVLYEDVVTISGQDIDAIVRTIAVDPTMTNHDNPSTTGFGMTNNEERFFSPQFNFSAAGEAEFRFEFILGGSYDNSTDSGTIVTLENVAINTYDIDGNGLSGTNQYNQFGGFYNTYLGSATTVSPTYDVGSGLTNFRSSISSNVSNVLDDNTRVQVAYSSVSSFTIVVGAEGGGYAYFFIDFGTGSTWTNPPDTLSPPLVDLDTSTPGEERTDTFCATPSYFTGGGTNIVTTNPTIDELMITYDSSAVRDGAYEQLLVQGAVSGDTLPLYFLSDTSYAVVDLNGVQFQAEGTISGEQRTITFTRLVGTMSVAETEMLLDSLAYYNAMPSTALRQFDVLMRSGAFTSLATQFNTLTSCSFLSIAQLDFEISSSKDNHAVLRWYVKNETDVSHYEIERSVNPEHWESIGWVSSYALQNDFNIYTFVDQNTLPSEICYRLTPYSTSNAPAGSYVECIDLTSKDPIVDVFPNPSKDKIQVNLVNCNDPRITFTDSRGLDISGEIKPLHGSNLEFDLGNLRQGLYFIHVETNSGIVTKPLTVVD